MSGICGLVNLDGAPVEPDVLKDMAEASAFRGPDGIRYWVDGNVGFAHLALNTTPESMREQQPLANKQTLLCLVADARVDNRDELIRTLTDAGYLKNRKPTDAGLILAAYSLWGVECPDRIIGDFAFAIWDANRQELFCARDAVGVRPFHYHFDGRTFWFGSDGRQVLADRRVSRDLDGYAISDFLTANFRDQARTVFANVQKLLPGHCLALKIGDQYPRGWRYWHPDRGPGIRCNDDAEYADCFRDLLFRSISDRTRCAKDAAAVMVSGGLDSSSIAASAQLLHDQGKIAAWPVGYTEVFDHLAECDEREYSLTLPAETGLELHQIVVEQFHILDDDVAYTPDIDSPVMNYESLTRHLLRKARERGCGVLMTGIGGDTLFDAAVWQYVDHARSGKWWKLRPWIAAGRSRGQSWSSLAWMYMIGPLLPLQFRYALDRWRGTWKTWHVPKWIHPHLRKKVHPEKRLYQQGYPKRFRSGAKQAQYEHLIGVSQLLPSIEWLNVRAAEEGLDATHPLFDRRIAEFVLAAPLDLSARPGQGNKKWMLRQAMKGILPERIRRRPDKGSWGKYIDYSMCRRAKQKFRDLFTDTQLSRYRFVDDSVLLREFDAFCAGDSHYHSGNIFIFPMCMEKWLRTYAQEQLPIHFKMLQGWQVE